MLHNHLLSLLPFHVFSTENDYVFVNMVDHGAVGIFAFPDFVMVS